MHFETGPWCLWIFIHDPELLTTCTCSKYAHYTSQMKIIINKQKQWKMIQWNRKDK